MRTHLTSDIKPALSGKKVTLGGWVSAIREHGNLKFIVLRDSGGTAQITAKRGDVPDAVFSQAGTLGKEDVIIIEGKVKKSEQAPNGVEIIPDGIKVLSKSEPVLPIDFKVGANLDTRLNWRFIDFRWPETQAVFKIQNTIIESFRKFFREKNFLEMQPPCIISSASEGGAELFAIPYFDKEAFLAQSPQLYKQMGAISFEKVFMVSPVFRAEKFDQPTHLNEIRQMDCEIGFADDEKALEVLEEVFVAMLKAVKKENEKELKILNRDLAIPKLPLKRITYSEAIQLLKDAGEVIEWGEDFTKTQEKRLREAVGQEAFFMKDWPTEIKAFYAMPHADNPAICKAYDLIYAGMEISSGTQRIHVPDLLAQQIEKKGLNPANFEYYINAFRFGAPPHAGWSIGLERLTMQVCGLQNIREATMFPRDRNRITP